MSTAMLIRLEALERRVAELEYRVAELRVWQGRHVTKDHLIVQASDDSPSERPYGVRRGARGLWYVFEGETRISGGMDKEDAEHHLTEVLRGKVEAQRIENADV